MLHRNRFSQLHTTIDLLCNKNASLNVAIHYKLLSKTACDITKGIYLIKDNVSLAKEVDDFKSAINLLHLLSHHKWMDKRIDLYYISCGPVTEGHIINNSLWCKSKFLFCSLLCICSTFSVTYTISVCSIYLSNAKCWRCDLSEHNSPFTVIQSFDASQLL